MEKLMNTIECPKCHTVINLDEEQYAKIVAQVRTEQFEKEVASQVKAVKEQQAERQEKLLMEAEGKYKLELAEKDQEITQLKAQAENAEAVRKQELEAAQVKAEMQRKDELAEKEREIQDLKAKADAAETDKKLAVTEAVEELRNKNHDLSVQIEQERRAADARMNDLKEAHKRDMDLLNGQIEFYKDMKIRQSTKMLGETLEQHCLTVFRQHREEFPNATFGKDNEVVEGTKGDFVYREISDDGIEMLSIMFEMKNEADDTVNKHKNEAFLDKLDKDRKKKNCEYAVLVSTLEPEDEIYNEGIVAAYGYDKMFIVRPQFFLTMIRVLHKAALASMDARRELTMIQRENLDVQKFVETLHESRDLFSKNYGYAQTHFDKAIKEINATIKHLENVRDELEATGRQLGNANNKLQELTIKKLTKGNIGMQQKFLDAGIAIE